MSHSTIATPAIRICAHPKGDVGHFTGARPFTGINDNGQLELPVS
ncbi:hypothetical protein [Musicola keenii]|nr:hypothetical protein [Musicola keenii]